MILCTREIRFAGEPTALGMLANQILARGEIHAADPVVGQEALDSLNCGPISFRTAQDFREFAFSLSGGSAPAPGSSRSITYLFIPFSSGASVEDVVAGTNGLRQPAAPCLHAGKFTSFTHLAPRRTACLHPLYDWPVRDPLWVCPMRRGAADRVSLIPSASRATTAIWPIRVRRIQALAQPVRTCPRWSTGAPSANP